MSLVNSVIKNILGDIDLSLYIACVVLAYGGVILRTFYTVMLRDPKSSGTPEHFEWKTFKHENLPRMIFSILLLPFALLFSQQFMGTELNTLTAFLGGLGIDMIAKKIFKPENRRDK